MEAKVEGNLTEDSFCIHRMLFLGFLLPLLEYQYSSDFTLAK